jgi:hypothetical protein
MDQFTSRRGGRKMQSLTELRETGEARPSHGLPRAHVLFIRESEHQLWSGGCAGHLEGNLLTDTGREPAAFAQRRDTMEALGPLYRAVGQRFGAAVQRDILDPRNLLTALIRVLVDARRYNVPWRETWRTLTAISPTCVIVNGRLFARGQWPEADELLAHLERLLGPAA